MKKIAVIGAGQMGNGIAHVFAQYGNQVNLIDVKQESLDKALATIAKNLDRQISKGILPEETRKKTLDLISTSTDIKSSLSDREVIIEAATENVDLKLKIFSQMDEFAPAGCILATNTSSISITRIAAATNRPADVIGMHFMNPVPVMKLIEIIKGYSTSDQVTDAIISLSKSIDKIPVAVNDYPGFVANKILIPMINEAVWTLYQGTAGVEEIDTIMKLGMAHPMGPLRLADFIGLDTCLSILRVLHDGYGQPKYAPCPLLVNMVLAGKVGDKKGEGFYDYSDPRNPVVSKSFRS